MARSGRRFAVWTWIGAAGQHPHGVLTTSGGKLSVDHHAVRRWVSPASEPLFLQGSIYAIDASSSGVVGRVLVEDSEVWQQYVAPGQTTPVPFALSSSVQAGDTVNFTLDPFEGTDAGDASAFEVQICR